MHGSLLQGGRGGGLGEEEEEEAVSLQREKKGARREEKKMEGGRIHPYVVYSCRANDGVLARAPPTKQVVGEMQGDTRGKSPGRINPLVIPLRDCEGLRPPHFHLLHSIYCIFI